MPTKSDTLDNQLQLERERRQKRIIETETNSDRVNRSTDEELGNN
ncbi:MAG: hypothetical protein WBQ25_20785 [Nitrososphaeraceae archaeon]